MKNIFILIFFIFSVMNFGQIRLSEKQIIFEKNEKLILDVNPYKNFEKFTPNESEIKIADEILEKTLISKKLKLEDYYRQYVGILKNGEKIIFVNTSCKNVDYFEKNTFYPKGGGRCYFRSFLNIQNKMTEKFIENAHK